jgi:D-serine deaminase-like pyridoxal phosphate-dependent protein
MNHATAPYAIADVDAIPSPALILFRPLIAQNLAAIARLAGSPDRVRLHAKTHKMPALIRMAEAAGFTRHKCATIAEAEMIARAGGRDVLLAYPLVGPSIARFVRLIAAYSGTTFRATADDPGAAAALSAALQGAGQAAHVLIDIDLGMGRTGIAPGDAAVALYEQIAALPGLIPDGIHAYDGHQKAGDLADRGAAVAAEHAVVLSLRDQLEGRGLPVPRLVLGGTPTFPLHARFEAPGVECSPGTCVLHDAGYGAAFPDLPFLPAALLLTRVISRPRPGRICLDLGHKAVAGDPPAGARVRIPDLSDASYPIHSEEHLVVDTAAAPDLPVGTPLLAIPTHICPTCALHRQAWVVDDGRVVETWEVAARDRVIGI